MHHTCLLFQVNGPAPNDTLWLDMTFAQPVRKINLVGNDSLASGSDSDSGFKYTRVIGLPGTQSLKSAGHYLLFKVVYREGHQVSDWVGLT